MAFLSRPAPASTPSPLDGRRDSRGVLCAATKAIRAARPLLSDAPVLRFALAAGKMGGLYPEALPVAAGRGKFTGWKREIARRRAQGRRQQMVESGVMEKFAGVRGCCQAGRSVQRPLVLECPHAQKAAEHPADLRDSAYGVRHRAAVSRVLPDPALDAYHSCEGCAGLSSVTENADTLGARQG